MKQRIEQINLIFLLMVLLPYLVVSILPIRSIVTDPVAGLVFSQLIRVAPILLFLGKNQYKVKQELKFQRIKLSTVLLLILLAYLILPVMNLISALSLLIGKNTMGATMTDLKGMYPLMISIFVVGILPAFAEEFIYRGVYLREYTKIDSRKAIVLSAFLFGILHQNFNQFTYAFIMGIVFALVVEATGSIWGSMIMHFVINTTSVVNMYYTKNSTGTGVAGRKEILQMVLVYAIPAMICTVLACVVFCIIAKREGNFERIKSIVTKSTGEEEKLSDQKISFVTIPLIFGMGLCVLEVIASIF